MSLVFTERKSVHFYFFTKTDLLSILVTWGLAKSFQPLQTRVGLQYKIMNQSEACLLKYELWNHEITLLFEKTFMWKSLYSMNEDQLQEVWKYMNKNLKQKFIKSLKSSAEYSVLFMPKLNDKKQLCINYKHLNNITKQDSYSLSLIKEFQKHLKDTK